MLEECKCESPAGCPQRPIVALKNSSYPGEIVHVDIFYPNPEVGTKKSYPFLLMIDNFSRMSIGKRLPNEKAGSVLQALISHWITPYGIARQIYSDAGSIFGDQEWIGWASLYGISLC